MDASNGGGRTIAAYASASVAASAVNFAAIIIWTRVLAPADYGHYSLFVTTGLVLHAVAFEWLRQSWARNLIEPRQGHEVSVSRAAALIRLWVGISLIVLITCLLAWIAGLTSARADPMWWVAITLYAVGEGGIALGVVTLRYRDLPGRYVVQVLGRALAALIAGGALFVVGGRQVSWLIGGVTLVQLGFLLLAYSDSLWLAAASRRARWADVKLLLSFGLPLMFTVSLNFVVGAGDRYIIQLTMGTSAVGLYGASADVVQRIINFSLLMINLVGYPAIVRTIAERGGAAGRQGLRRNFHLQLGLGLPIALTIAALAPGFARLALGAEYQDAAKAVLPWIAGAALVRALTAFHTGPALQLANRPSLTLIAPLLSALLLGGVGWWGTQVAGLEGIAVAAFVASVFGWLSSVVLARRTFDRNLFDKDSMAVVISALVMAAVLWSMRDHGAPGQTVLLAILGLCIYAAMLVALNALGVRSLLAKRFVGKRASGQ